MVHGGVISVVLGGGCLVREGGRWVRGDGRSGGLPLLLCRRALFGRS